MSQRVGVGEWECLDSGCYDPEDFARSFQSIDGFSERELYAVGERGEVWSFDGSRWRAIESPTRAAMNSVVCAGDGQVYAVGADGTLLVGRGEQWRLITAVARGLEFWSARWLGETLYLTADTRSLFAFCEVSGLRPADFGDCPAPTTTHHLKTAGDSLWSFGSKDIRVLRAGVWSEVR